MTLGWPSSASLAQGSIWAGGTTKGTNQSGLKDLSSLL